MGIKNKTLVDSMRRNDRYFEDYITRSVNHSNAIAVNYPQYQDHLLHLYLDRLFRNNQEFDACDLA